MALKSKSLKILLKYIIILTFKKSELKMGVSMVKKSPCIL